ncbi:hypothetical protein K7I13_06285 [Brucepastera parasyntrophica]|uniref:PG0541 family transporter-associated protein n=1 Tax=Brucepastera parasyntrophica TaxID=2880008 RepID=UPI002109F9EC|nr:PG0541 family transporter-associated protein [Brucepastera parasyntrophica]ULQ60870.1 hypothetical protein K7I13_06285 [Brucepastera parasyntrophica]
MKRLEIIANKSVQDEILTGLENTVADFYYTLIPVVHGRGKNDYKTGSAVWPEENFLAISYLDDKNAESAVRVIQEIKNRFPEEGIKFFLLKAE